MTDLQRWAATGLAAGIPVAVFLAIAAGPGWLALVAALLAAGGLIVPGFRRSLMTGAAAGATAGILVLGPAFRLAMRVVAVTDPLRRPEFTVGGTFFVVVVAGSILGGLLGVGVVLVRRAWSLSPIVVSGAVAALGTGLLLIDTDLRGELLNLGVGAAVNIPLFALAWALYGVAAVRLAARIERRLPRFEPVAV